MSTKVKSVEWVESEGDEPRGHYRVRLGRLVDGSRPFADLPPGPKSTIAEERARETMLAMTERARERGLTAKDFGIVRRRSLRPTTIDPKVETVGQWSKRYLAAKKAKGLRTVGEMTGRWKNWILPNLGEDSPMRSITPRDVERVVMALDAEVSKPDAAIRWKTAANIFSDMRSAFDEATRSKDRSLRVLEENPAKDVRGPDRGDERAKSALYPDEFLKLVSHPLVPMNRKRTYAVAVYTAARSNELAALTARNFDIAHLKFTIDGQVNRKSKTKEVRKTKTGLVRTSDIERELLPLLDVLIKTPEGKDGRLLRMPPDEDRAELLRKDLRTAGVTRAELFDDSSHLQIRLHSLRDTGLIFMAVRGDSNNAIQWRGGHTDYQMTQKYVDAGKRMSCRASDVFPPLPSSLLGVVEEEKEHPPLMLAEGDPNGEWPVSWPKNPDFSSNGAFSSAPEAIPMGIEPMFPT